MSQAILKQTKVGSHYLVGRVYNHPKKEDGKLVRTGWVVSWDATNRIAKTDSGTEYHIEEATQCEEDTERRILEVVDAYKYYSNKGEQQ